MRDIKLYDPFEMKVSPDPCEDSAVTRHKLYTVLSHLFFAGLNQKTMRQARHASVLMSQLPIAPNLGQMGTFHTQLRLPITADPNLDHCAAEHETVLHTHVMPMESRFLAHSGDEAAVDKIARIYHTHQHRPMTDTVDHIESHLRFIAYLTTLESSSWERGMLPMAIKARGYQKAFLQNHLLRWLPPFIVALRSHSHPFYQTLADVTWHLAYTHYTDVVNYYDLMPHIEINFALDTPPLLESGALETIKTMFLSPELGGVWLGQHDIDGLCEACGVPCSDGTRSERLDALFDTADPDQLRAELKAWLENWTTQYTLFHDVFPAVRPFITPWRTQTEHLLTRLS